MSKGTEKNVSPMKIEVHGAEEGWVRASLSISGIDILPLAMMTERVLQVPGVQQKWEEILKLVVEDVARHVYGTDKVKSFIQKPHEGN